MTPIDKLLSRDGVRAGFISPLDLADSYGEPVYWSCKQDETMAVIDAAHVAKLEAALKKAVSALESVQDNPTGDSTGIINHRNTWTNWAKERASEALAEIEKIAGGK